MSYMNPYEKSVSYDESKLTTIWLLCYRVMARLGPTNHDSNVHCISPHRQFVTQMIDGGDKNISC